MFYYLLLVVVQITYYQIFISVFMKNIINCF